jgi:hypothetical protein
MFSLRSLQTNTAQHGAQPIPSASCVSWASFSTMADHVGASSYPAQGAGDALALSDSPLESRGRPGEGERAAATSWRTRPEHAADAEGVMR